jgi:outer membrane immunogenic protein
MVRKLLLSSAAWIAMAGAAGAADLPFKAAPAAVAPAWSWTGLYIGINGGVASYRSDVNFSDVANSQGENGGSPFGSAARGGLFGGQIGFNWQIRKLVLGLEGDGDFLFGLKKTTRGGWVDTGTTTNSQLSSDATGFTSFRARFGFDVLDGTLVYGTAGVGWLKMNNTWNVLNLDGNPTPKGGNFLANSWQPAFVVGGGFETMLDPHWSVRGEVLWVLPENANVGPQDTHFFTPPAATVNHTTEAVFGRIGLSYKLW